MRAVIAILGASRTADVAAAVARRMTGPTVVVPYDALLNRWVAKPGDGEAEVALAAQQAKLLVAGYVKAGYHTLIEGTFVRSGRREDGAVEAILRLMQTVPDVETLSVLVSGGDESPVAEAYRSQPATDLTCDLHSVSVDQAAEAVWEALPVESFDRGGH